MKEEAMLEQVGSLEESKNKGFFQNITKYFDSTFVVGFVLLLNLVCFSLFRNVRLDFTSSGVYTISKMSKDTVKSLSDPLSIKVFFSGNIPAPHNALERYVRDLLGSYSSHGNKNFSYTFYDCSEYKNNRRILENLQEASRNGIESVQIESYEQGEVKIARVYMGMSIEYAGSISRVYFNSVRPEELEYKITSLLHAMSAKKSKVQSLTSPIVVKLCASGALEKNAALFGVENWPVFVELVKSSVENFSERFYGKIQFEISSEKNMDVNQLKQAGVTALRVAKSANSSKEDLCYAFLQITSPSDGGDSSQSVSHRDLIGVGVSFAKGQPGLVYRVLPSADVVGLVEAGVDSVLEMSDRISYLTDKGCISVVASSSMMFQQNQQQSEGDVLRKLLSRSYAFQEVTSRQLNFLSSKSLIIAGNTEAWADEELFYLDQFLLQGGSLLVFHDGLTEQVPGAYGALVKENITGLERLLKHYGVVVENQFVMDERCFRRRENRGGDLQEVREYQIPLLRKEQFPKNFLPLKNIQEMFLYKPTALHLTDEVQSSEKVQCVPLFVSSEKSWVSQEAASPFMQADLLASNKRPNIPMGYCLQGNFASYFEVVPKGLGTKETPASEMHFLRESAKPGKVILVGSSYFVKSFALEEREMFPNTKVFMNLIDYANNREGWIPLRSKNIFFRPLEDFANMGGLRSLIFSSYDAFKYFNVFGLPILLAMMGLFAYTSLKRRKIAMQARYSLG